MSIEVKDGSWERRGGLKYWIGRFFLWMLRFEMDYSTLPKGDKFVIIAAPHTSNWDLPLMLGCSYIAGLKVSWLGKDTIFRGPWESFFKWLGGIPVDRSAAKGMTAQVAEVFKTREKLAVAIPPEGTRRLTPGWKTGFYYIALQAEVPIVMSYLDYSKRRAGFGPMVHPSGDIEADFEIFREFYKDKIGKIPAWTSEVKIREDRKYHAKTEKKPGSLQMFKDILSAAKGSKPPVEEGGASKQE